MNNIKIFRSVLSNKVSHCEELKEHFKELTNIVKITNINYKFKYYEVKNKQNNEVMTNLFCEVQQAYYIISNFVTKLKYKYCKTFNNEDLMFNSLENEITFNVIINNFIYKFTYYEFINIINNSLLHFETNSNQTLHNIFSAPLEIKNPYTNVVFNKNVLYNFYNFIINYTYSLPVLFKLYYESDFEISSFFILHENYITVNSIQKHIKNSTNSYKFEYLINAITIFTSFINKHLYSNYRLVLLLNNFKLKIYSMDKNKVGSFDAIIVNYLLIIYYFKIKHEKDYVINKIKLVTKILKNNIIKFSDRSISYLESNDIIESINHNYESIINIEFDDLANISTIANNYESRNTINNIFTNENNRINIDRFDRINRINRINSINRLNRLNRINRINIEDDNYRSYQNTNNEHEDVDEEPALEDNIENHNEENTDNENENTTIENDTLENINNTHDKQIQTDNIYLINTPTNIISNVKYGFEQINNFPLFQKMVIIISGLNLLFLINISSSIYLLYFTL